MIHQLELIMSRTEGRIEGYEKMKEYGRELEYYEGALNELRWVLSVMTETRERISGTDELK